MSDIQDQRPSNARRPNPNQPTPSQDAQELVIPPRSQIETMDSEAAVLLIKKSNPGISFARAESLYAEHYSPQLLRAEEPEVPLQRPTYDDEPLPTAEKVEYAAHAHVEEVTRGTVVDDSPAPVVQQPPAQPAPENVTVASPGPSMEHPHLHAEVPRQEQTTAPEPVARKAADHEDAAPKVPEQTVERQINFGDKQHLAETSALDNDDPNAILLQTSTLLGLSQDPNLIAEELQSFLRSIKRSPKDGRPLFSSQEEKDRYERIYRALNMTPPRLQDGTPSFSGALERDDTAWEQRVDLGDGGSPAGAISPRDNMHTGAIAALRRVRKSGIPNSVWLPATGIYVGFRAPHERDLCDFDMRLTLETATIGMQTYGLMLSSSSGVYMRHMVEFALQFVTEATIDCEGNDLRTVLLEKVDLADYWLIILGPLQAKFPAGIPWTLLCGEKDCTSEEAVKLNIARCIRFGTGLFTDLQKQLWARQRGTERPMITMAEQEEYVKSHPIDPAAIFDYNQVKVEFGRASLGRFFDSTERWIEDVNASTTAALAEFGTERERENHMRLTAESRRLTRYAHMVKSITVVEYRDVNGETQPIPVTETNEQKIIEMLEELSSDRLYVGQFENAIAEYIERTRLAVFGYMGKRCPQCGKQHGEKEGMYRGIVTISPDRVFFVLSRVVSEIQKFLLDQYADIG
ncbi:hypothetical protein MLDJOKPK_00127 [Salmonella phage SPAsTU]|nr:hypothetical protein STsAS_022 [Salmonella phage STsAS]AWN09057.1 hypothetical protein MLDJOKPK_00127 [Salmonella phage SPAsTU]